MEESQKPIPQHLNDFLDWIDVEKGLSSKTQENYERFLRKFFEWLKQNKLENIKPHEFTSQHIWDYRLYLSRHINPKTGKSLKRSTQNYYLIALRALLSYFSAKDVVCLPSDKIALPRADKKEKTVKFLTLEQVEKLLLAPDINNNNVIGLRDRAILETLFSTGLRISELTSLNRDQFVNIKNKKDLEVSIVGKGEYPRTVYFSERALNWLKKYLETRSDKEKPLFIHYSGRKDAPSRLTQRSVERFVKKYAVKSGIPIFTTPHTLRHSYATDLLAQGVDLRNIQEFLGHRSIISTQIYTHVTNKRLRDIHRKFHSGGKMKE